MGFFFQGITSRGMSFNLGSPGRVSAWLVRTPQVYADNSQPNGKPVLHGDSDDLVTRTIGSTKP